MTKGDKPCPPGQSRATADATEAVAVAAISAVALLLRIRIRPSGGTLVGAEVVAGTGVAAGREYHGVWIGGTQPARVHPLCHNKKCPGVPSTSGERACT